MWSIKQKMKMYLQGVHIGYTRVSRAPCSPAQLWGQHLVALVEYRQCDKFGVDSSTFPSSLNQRIPIVKNVSRPWHMRHAPLGDGNHKGSWFTVEVTWLSGETHAAWPVTLTKYYMQSFARRHVARGTWHKLDMLVGVHLHTTCVPAAHTPSTFLTNLEWAAENRHRNSKTYLTSSSNGLKPNIAHSEDWQSKRNESEWAEYEHCTCLKFDNFAIKEMFGYGYF